jgi:hypothetical protein
MARELGMNPKKVGKIDNHKQERWKAPLPIFIEDLYYKRFGRERPETVVTIEQRARQITEKKAAQRAAKAARRAVAEHLEAPSPSGGALLEETTDAGAKQPCRKASPEDLDGV